MAATLSQAGGLLTGDEPAVYLSLFTYNRNQLGITSWCYAIDAITGLVRYGDIAQDFLEQFEADLLATLGEDTTLLGIKCGLVSGTGTVPYPAPGVSESYSLGTFGGATGPKQITGLIRWSTPFSGRAYRGRQYWPFVPLAAVADTEPSAAYVLALTSVANDINSYISNSGTLPLGGTYSISQVIYHRKTVTSTAVTAGYAPYLFAGQHRRGDFGRTNPEGISG